MTFTEAEVKALIETIGATRVGESPCDECLQGVAAFAEAELGGRSVPDATDRVRTHLERCGDCREEYEALRLALQELDEASEWSSSDE